MGISLFATTSRPALGPIHPAHQWVPKAFTPGSETDHSLPSLAEVKNAWSYTSTPAVRLHDVVFN